MNYINREKINWKDQVVKPKFKTLWIDDTLVHLKKDGKSYRVVHPIRNEDGSINWFNLFTGGSWKNIIVTTIIILVILGLLLEYSQNINMFLNCFKDIPSLEVCKQSFGGENLRILVP
jgi:hypothetical protein